MESETIFNESHESQQFLEAPGSRKQVRKSSDVCDQSFKRVLGRLGK